MKIDMKDLNNKCKLNVKEIFDFLKAHQNIVWSWGAKSWTEVRTKSENDGTGLAFNVSGFIFKGNVMITLNGLDLFDVYFYNRLGKKVNEFNNIYLDDLIELLDDNIEKVKHYQAKIIEV